MSDKFTEFRNKRILDNQKQISEFVMEMETTFNEQQFREEWQLVEYVKDKFFKGNIIEEAPDKITSEQEVQKDIVVHFIDDNFDVVPAVYRLRFKFDPLNGEKYFIGMEEIGA